MKVKNAVIDGELACPDSEGRSIFNELLLRKRCPVFYAFDLLYLNNRDLRQLPLRERKEKLKALIEKGGLPDVICGKYVEGRGVDLFKQVVRRNLEGVVSAMGGRSSVCRRKNSPICARLIGLMLEALSVVNEIFP